MTVVKPITGVTRMIASLADPVIQVRAPSIMNAVFARHGLDWIMHPMHVKPENLGATVAVLRRTSNYIAFTTTIPHKQQITRLSDELMPNAKLCGAANVTKIIDGRLVSEIFDGIGMIGGMAKSGVTVAGRRVLVCGAGGAARAIAFALCKEKPACVHVHNRSEFKALELAEAMRRAVPALEIAAVSGNRTDYDVIINATSLGLKEGDPTPLDFGSLNRETDVACVVAPRESETILAARAKGCRVVPGIEMMKAQAEAITAFIADR
ncbi:shikimate dehydrogenase family protein [Chelatococcus asaccharovorans]|uniref:shikimate dehydrogenase (NADP(+)) n=1 Tax=Chelatococcus asaccharovorans TaxID=28210 RepID=A0A2V3TYC6_9HYPH|nr:shikimate dehydrogenase [Chelatococcus asaccharovorans]MBS7705182.1 shikimate dehydrogenase [Chelatococcus asaccharovorans]PXW53680.1 shikimate dehydrogenase [Chelatococcus asaccharovorans]CAH1653386.1 Shikimate 5-dehydrogenase I alpha [Chelatococcus asaccharovorans]CAH1686061.1 Shikimate 5-dehydrogenase I alpha [Chelatococcus asaccharovorans]